MFMKNKKRKNDSKFRDAYGYTLSEMTALFAASSTKILKWHYTGVLQDKLNDRLKENKS